MHSGHLGSSSAAGKQVLDTEARSKMEQIKAETDAKALTVRTQAEIETMKAKGDAEKELIKNKKESTELLQAYPALMRLEEIKGLDVVLKNANAKIYMGLDTSLIGKIEKE